MLPPIIFTTQLNDFITIPGLKKGKEQKLTQQEQPKPIVGYKSENEYEMEQDNSKKQSFNELDDIINRIKSQIV